MARYWNGSATAPWVTLQDKLDALLGPPGLVALRQANPDAGENVLDVGCGCGATTLEFASRVGRSGRVLGVDISEQLLARARERVVEMGFSQVTLKLADAGTYPFELESFDHLYSRLGIMFFGTPVAAFANLRSALKPSGQMTFLCCRTPAENTYISTAVQAARPLLPSDAMPIPGPDEPGMFSRGPGSRSAYIGARWVPRHQATASRREYATCRTGWSCGGCQLFIPIRAINPSPQRCATCAETSRPWCNC